MIVVALHQNIKWIHIKVCWLKKLLTTSAALVLQFVGFSCCFQNGHTHVDCIKQQEGDDALRQVEATEKSGKKYVASLEQSPSDLH